MGYQKKYKKFVATAATATLVASAIVPVASAKSFSDVAENNEFQPFIDALSDAGIINGYQDGTFKPGNKLTRGQVVKMLGRWVEANGQEIPADWNSVQRFNDVPTNSADEELVKYAALVKDAGVFTGSNGNLMAGNNITRQQMAKVLNGAYTAINGFSLVDLADSIDNKLVTDLASAQQEFEGYIQALVDLEISTVSVFRPTENVTRAQFAKFLYNTINLEVVDAVGVKAINNTTVEVTFAGEIDDIKALKFTIDGLEVKNAAVKQTDAKTAVLTTAAQEGDKEYTISVDGEKVGTFKGIAAVIPTSIKLETTSVQQKVGSEVTLKATTTPGAAVTFNVRATGNSLNENKKVEVIADTNGVATYSYTQYGVAGVDEVTVYPTGAPNLLDYAKVYWGKEIILTVDVEEKTVDNGGNRVYTVTYRDATTGQPVSGKNLNVTFKENLNDIDGSKTNDTTAAIRKTQNTTATTTDTLYVTPYQDSTATAGSNREEAFQVTTNTLGQATFTVTGKNTSATPIVFEDADKNSRFNVTELQATAGAVKFQGVQSPYTITWEKTADFVAAMSQEYGQQNPIEYKLKVVTDKKDDKGEAIPYAGATIKVAIQQNIDAPLNNNTPAQISGTENGSYTTSGVVSVVTDEKGEAKVYLKSTVDNTKATPVAWIDLNTAGNNATVGNDRLEEGEPNAVAPTVTFLKSVVVAPNYSLNTPTAGAFVQGDRMTWKASLENQSGKVSETAGVKNATYTVTNTSNKILTINPRLVDVDGIDYKQLTVTYSGQTQTQPFTNGSAVKLEPGTTVTIHGVAPGLASEYGQTTVTQNNQTIVTTAEQKEYSTTNDAILHVEAPAVDGKLSVSANVTTVRKTVTQDTRNNNNTYSYDAKVAEFITATVVGNNNATVTSNPTVTGEVIGYDIVDKSTDKSIKNQPKTNKFNVSESNNYGRVVIKERNTGVIKVFYYDSVDTFSAALDGSFNAQTDNLLAGVTAFEKLLSVGDEIQVNANTAQGTYLQMGDVRLFNEDKSTDGKTEGNVPPVVVVDEAPTITSAVALDLDGNGNYDAVKFVFSEAINKATVDAADFRFTDPSGVDGVAGTIVAGTRLEENNNANEITVYFGNAFKAATAATLEFDYAGSHSLTGGLQLADLTGNKLAPIKGKADSAAGTVENSFNKVVSASTNFEFAETVSVGFKLADIQNTDVKADPTKYKLQLADGTKYDVIKNTEATEESYAVLYLPKDVNLTTAVFVKAQ